MSESVPAMLLRASNDFDHKISLAYSEASSDPCSGTTRHGPSYCSGRVDLRRLSPYPRYDDPPLAARWYPVGE